MVIKVFKLRKSIFFLFFVVLSFVIAVLSLQSILPQPETAFVLEEGVNYDDQLLNEKMLSKAWVDKKISKTEPSILIIHTHTNEGYEGGGGVVNVGTTLGEILANDYGLTVVHDIKEYDMVDGNQTTEGAYERMEAGVSNILQKYPTIEVVIDLHRDSAQPDTTTDNIAKLMFVNGICQQGDLTNNYLKENLTFTLKMYNELKEEYPSLMRKNYIKPYRYSTHLKPLSLLVEAGSEANTVEEAKNSMEPLAKILAKVLVEKG
ncbi:MAG: stage II sporulation protein P [Anaerotignaceae bacterium]